MSKPTDRNPEITDKALHALGDRLDVLGSDDRRQPVGLEERVLAAVADTIAPPPIVLEPTRAWWRSGALRSAAGVALLGSVAAVVYLAQRGPSTTTGPVKAASLAAVEDRIEGMFALADLAAGESFDDSIASIDLWVEALDAESTGGWRASGYADDWFGEGAL